MKQTETRYYVMYQDPTLIEKCIARFGSLEDVDPARYWTERDFTALAAARRFARENAGMVYERVVADEWVTPDGIILVDYDSRLLYDQGEA